MASSDARPIPQKNVAYRITFPIYDNDGDLVVSAAGLDSEISQDGGTFADCTNEATQIATNSGIYYLDLTSTEMNADTVAIIVKTSTTDAKTTVLVMYPEEAGDIRVNVTAYGGTAGTFSAGRPEVNTSHWGGTAVGSALVRGNLIEISGSNVSTSTAQLGVNAVQAGGTAWASGAITANSLASNAITDAKIATDAITAAKIANGAIDAATFAADVDAEILSYLVDDATRIDASALNTASGAVGSNGSGLTEAGGTGDHLTALATAAALATVDSEIGTIDGNVDLILEDTATTIPAQITGLNNLSAAQVNAEVDSALADIHLDHLLAVNYDPADKPGTATALLNELVESDGGVSRFTANALEEAPTGGAAPSAADIADAVWDEALSGHTTGGTYGKAVADIEADATLILEDTGTTLPTALATAQADLDTITGSDGATLATAQGNYAPSKAGDAMALVNDAITAAKYDETTAFPVTSADTSTTRIARTGADSDTLETLSDEIATRAAPGDSMSLTGAHIETIRNNAWTTIAAGYVGDTGNDTTHIHLRDSGGTPLTFLNDALNDLWLVIQDDTTGLRYKTKITDWVNSTALATVDELPFTPAESDQYGVLSIPAEVEAAVVDVEAIADAVWDEALSGHTTGGTYGKAVADIEADATLILEDTGTTLPTAIADVPTVAEFEARTIAAANYATSTALATAQADLDTVTGSDGATLATAQGNYAPSKAGDAMALVNDAITAAKYDETTAFPLASVDSGSTAVARTGADADTLETLSDEIATRAAPGDSMSLTGAHIETIRNNAWTSIAAGYLGDTGNDSTHLHLTGLTFTNDELNDLWIVVQDDSNGRRYKTKITDWVDSTALATVDALPFTPAEGDQYGVMSIPCEVEAGGGIATEAKQDTIIAALGVVDDNVDSILADTNELQGDWVNGGRLDMILDARASQTSVDDIPTNGELATALGGLNDLDATEVQTAAAAALTAYDPPTKAELDAAVSGLATQTSVNDIPTNAEFNAAIDALPTAAENATSVWASGTRTLTSFGTLVADTAAAVWAIATSALTTAGTIGKLIVDNLNATVSSRASQTSVDDIPTNSELATALGGLNDLDSTAVQTAAAAALTAYDSPTKAELDAAVSPLATTAELAKVPKSDSNVTWNATAAAQIQSEANDALVAYDPPTNTEMEARTLAAAEYATAVNLQTVDDNVDSILADTNELQVDWADGGRLDLILDARASQTSVDDLPTNAELATALAGADDAVLAEVALVKAQTDQLTFTEAGNVDSNIKYVNDVEVAGTGETGDEWGPS